MNRFKCVADSSNVNEFETKDEAMQWLQSEGGGAITHFVWDGEWVQKSKEYINEISLKVVAKSE